MHIRVIDCDLSRQTSIVLISQCEVKLNRCCRTSSVVCFYLLLITTSGSFFAIKFCYSIYETTANCFHSIPEHFSPCWYKPCRTVPQWSQNVLKVGIYEWFTNLWGLLICDSIVDCLSSNFHGTHGTFSHPIKRTLYVHNHILYHHEYNVIRSSIQWVFFPRWMLLDVRR